MDALNSCKIITTNTGAKTPKEAIERAEIVLLAEDHVSKVERVIDRIINTSFKNGDVLLTEQPPSWLIETRRRVINMAILKKAQCWDIDLEEVYKVLRQITSLKLWARRAALFYVSIAIGGKSNSWDEEDYNEVVKVVQEFRPFKNVWTLKGPECAYDEMLSVWLEAAEALKRRLDLVIEKTFYPRNKSMIEKILAYRGKGKVFVIAGHRHLKYWKPAYEKAVEIVYKGLQEKEIPYVTLQPRKNQSLKPTKRELNGTLHSKKSGQAKYLSYLWKGQKSKLHWTKAFGALREGLQHSFECARASLISFVKETQGRDLSKEIAAQDLGEDPRICVWLFKLRAFANDKLWRGPEAREAYSSFRNGQVVVEQLLKWRRPLRSKL